MKFDPSFLYLNIYHCMELCEIFSNIPYCRTAWQYTVLCTRVFFLGKINFVQGIAILLFLPCISGVLHKKKNENSTSWFYSCTYMAPSGPILVHRSNERASFECDVCFTLHVRVTVQTSKKSDGFD